MGRKKIEFYSIHECEVMKQRYESLPEKGQRHFLAFEYLRLGEGSQTYLASVYQSSKDRIRRGVREVKQDNFNPDYSRQRNEGGGRTKKK